MVLGLLELGLELEQGVPHLALQLEARELTDDTDSAGK